MTGYYQRNELQSNWAGADAAYHEEKLARAEAEASKWFNYATTRQLAQHREMVASAVRQHGHGSAAHLAVIALSDRQWKHDTKEAQELCELTLAELLETGEVSEELAHRWDQLAVCEAMSEAAE